MSHFSGAKALLSSGKGQSYNRNQALTTNASSLAAALPTEVLVNALLARRNSLNMEEVGQLAILSGSVQLDSSTIRRLTSSLLAQLQTRDQTDAMPSDAYLKLKLNAVNTLTNALRQIDAKAEFEEVERVFIAAIQSVAIAHGMERELLQEVKDELEVLFMRDPDMAQKISMKIPPAKSGDVEEPDKISILPVARRD